MKWISIACGATLGAWLRFLLGGWFNALHDKLPLGTLAANLGGGFVIGASVAFFEAQPNIAPEWRLFLITGFLGGLTTFSTFSAESMVLLQKGDYLWALGHSGVHLLGSIVCCFLGHAAYRAVMVP